MMVEKIIMWSRFVTSANAGNYLDDAIVLSVFLSLFNRNFSESLLETSRKGFLQPSTLFCSNRNLLNI